MMISHARRRRTLGGGPQIYGQGFRAVADGKVTDQLVEEQKDVFDSW